jgi:hypothetical protein
VEVCTRASCHNRMLSRARSRASSSCWAGTAPGSWHGYEWRLRNGSDNGHEKGPRCPPLQRYVHAELRGCTRKIPSPVPNAPPSNVRSCTARDERMIEADVGNTSVLMVGDSTSAQVLWHACEAFNARPSPFIHVDARAFNVSLRRYTHRLRSLDNHACRLPGNVLLGSFSHYGVTGPPYWAFAYPLAPWLAETTVGQARRDVPKIRAMATPAGTDPTLVVASSGFWDIAAWWAHEGNFSRHWSCCASPASAANHTAQYVAGVHRLVRELRRSFPRSSIVWRLMHPGAKLSISPRIVAQLNAAVRAAAPAWRLPLLDVETMVNSLSKSNQPNLGKGPPYGTVDGRHLHPWVNMALLNVVLNMARYARTGGDDLPYGSLWRSASGGRAVGGGGNHTGLTLTHTANSNHTRRARDHHHHYHHARGVVTTGTADLAKRHGMHARDSKPPPLSTSQLALGEYRPLE